MCSCPACASPGCAGKLRSPPCLVIIHMHGCTQTDATVAEEHSRPKAAPAEASWPPALPGLLNGESSAAGSTKGRQGSHTSADASGTRGHPGAHSSVAQAHVTGCFCHSSSPSGGGGCPYHAHGGTCHRRMQKQAGHDLRPTFDISTVCPPAIRAPFYVIEGGS